MIKSIDRYINFSSMKRKKVQHIINILTIIIIISTLVMGSAASSWNVYGQSNETDSQTENVIRIIPETSQDEITENTNEQLTSETSSADNSSGIINDDQNIAGESNTLNGPLDSQPDGDCLFDPSLPKCAPNENGNCPEGFHMNEDEQCFPAHDRCPSGYHSHEDDESGKCIPDSVPCDPGYIMSPDFPTCEYKDSVCQKYPDLNECKVDDSVANNQPYRSGYDHGCSDAKISDSNNRYINQPGKGPTYHTSEFMRGYNDGFESCLRDNGSSSSPIANGIFRIIVQVTNQSPQDIAGSITVSIDRQPENIFKSAYGLYFPAGETTSTTFTLKSSDVPVGTEYEVNLDYDDDYNQYTFGENSPVKRPEIVTFNIP